MKSTIYILAMAIFLLTSCAENNSGKEEKNSPNKEALISTAPDDEASETVAKTDNCQEFLNKYETWAEGYIQLLITFTSSPADPGLAKEYNRLRREYSTWTEDWIAVGDCTSEEEFLKRYESINRKIEIKQKQLRGD